MYVTLVLFNFMFSNRMQLFSKQFFESFAIIIVLLLLIIIIIIIISDRLIKFQNEICGHRISFSKWQLNSSWVPERTIDETRWTVESSKKTSSILKVNEFINNLLKVCSVYWIKLQTGKDFLVLLIWWKMIVQWIKIPVLR